MNLRLLLLLAALVGSGCDPTGLHPLGALRDVTSNCARSTWIRSTEEGTELFLFGTDDPTAPSPLDPATGEPVPTCMARAFVAHDTSTTLEQGAYTVGEDGTGTFAVNASYRYVYEPTLTTFDRYGSRRDDMPVPSSHAIAVAESGAQLAVAFDGEARRMTNLGELIGRLDPTTQAGAETVFALYNLPLFTSFARLVGFQAIGMTEYLNSQATFQGLSSSHFTVVVLGSLLSPHNVLDFVECEDLNGIVIDGTQDTYINAPIQADGTMSGVLSFEMRSDTGEVLRGGVDYAGIVVDNGVAGGGEYGFALEGHGEYVIPYTLGDEIDLRSILPVSEGLP